MAEEQTGLFVQIKDSIESMGLTITVGSGSLGLPLEVVHYSSSPVTKKRAFLSSRSEIIVHNFYLISQ